MTMRKSRLGREKQLRLIEHFVAGTTGFSLHRALSEAGVDCWVVAACKIPRTVVAGAKTDRLDCIRLAEYSAKGLLKPIAVPTAQEEGERTLIRRRAQIVDNVRRVKIRIKSLLLYLGEPEPPGLRGWSQKALRHLEVLQLEPSARLSLNSHLRELAFHQSELQEVESTLKALMKSRHAEALKRLRSIPGVGFVVATTFLLEIFRPERFDRPEEVASYLGLAPMVRQSGERSSRGSLAPVGQKRLRSLLIEAAWLVVGKVPEIKARYSRLVSRLGIPQKAIAAVARYLAITLWRLSLPRRSVQTV